MSKMRDKLRALHKPRPTEVPATDRESRAEPTPAEGATSDHRPLTAEEAHRPPHGATTRPPTPTRRERARELPERLDASERSAPLPQKSVIGTPNTVTTRGMDAWRKRRAQTGSGAPERRASAETSSRATTEQSGSAGSKGGDERGVRSSRGRQKQALAVTRHPRRNNALTWHRPARHLSELAPGHIRIAAGRNIFVARRYYPADNKLAGARIDAARKLPAATLAEHGLSPDSVLAFLDIESSGLSGQQGSVPFMVGIATWQADGLLADVITMHEPDDEPGALLLVSALLETVDAIVTFNGHVFDLPFLRQRFAAHGLDASALELPHIDAYRVARQVLKGRKGRGAFKLTTLEQDLLGIVREGDIPGSEAPPRWFQTQRDGEVERLLPLLEHNQHDIMTLPALLYALLSAEQSGERRAEQSGKARRTPSGPVARLAAATSHDPDARHTADEHTASPIDQASKTANEHRGDPVALLRRGLTAYQEGRFPEAAAMLEAADFAGLNKQQRWSALKTLAQVQDALGQTRAAEQTWRTLSELPSTDPLPLTRLVAIARDRGDDEAADALAARAKQRAAWWREE